MSVWYKTVGCISGFYFNKFSLLKGQKHGRCFKETLEQEMVSHTAQPADERRTKQQ